MQLFLDHVVILRKQDPGHVLGVGRLDKLFVVTGIEDWSSNSDFPGTSQGRKCLVLPMRSACPQNRTPTVTSNRGISLALAWLSHGSGLKLGAVGRDQLLEDAIVVEGAISPEG